jgi:molecular chaperone HscC
LIVGIDLGTTNSAIARWHDGRAELIPNALGATLTPSAVSLAEDASVLVGAAARDRQITHPERTATTFKRLMGTSQKVTLDGVAFTPEDLSALVLRQLREDAERHCGEPVTGAIITVPAYFNDRQRKATRRAGQLAGLHVERLVNEPTAAALAYGIVDRSDREPFLVFDLGGGTFDVSIVDVFDGIIEVRASAGDNRLGGEDFTAALAVVARARAGVPSDPASPRLDEAVRAEAERVRIALSDADSATFSLVWADRRYEAELSGADLEAAAAPLLDRLREPVLRAMRDCRLRAEEMSEIVLVGGATRMPIVRRAVTRMFGRFPSHVIDPDQAIALGAAVQAGLKARAADLAEIRLTDICPFSLGTDVADRGPQGQILAGRFKPLIERGTVLPASRVHRFVTMTPNQAKVEFDIYQGEARRVDANVLLGSLSIPVPPRPAGEIALDCRFSYDVSGLLEVDVTVLTTGETHQLVLNDDESIDPAELAARRAALAALKVHPRDEARHRALLARAERCFELFLGDQREFVAGLIAHFEAVLATQEPREIAEAHAAISARLDQLERERPS